MVLILLLISLVKFVTVLALIDLLVLQNLNILIVGLLRVHPTQWHVALVLLLHLGAVARLILLHGIIPILLVHLKLMLHLHLILVHFILYELFV